MEKLIALFLAMSTVSMFFIEACKKLVSTEQIKKIFKTLNWFSLVISIICGIVAYIGFILFSNDFANYDISQKIFIGFVFSMCCGVGSQLGYDNVLKVIKDLMGKK